ncbi:hypothetical protein B7C51_08440 [Paenibacillus larvae subsp. pulvifaciens]|uniref:Bacterial type II secretion system protein E domain-containing protein n=1 Tax=Paenibacillus larvae subsp. pulvifaciens TaxID=1477 RepID=A0A1V0URF1_9BACL|nr:CpaF/VirB11 family protein [Paenibacillus larvae]ARF67849.1 hypothetical protein B7C51_08440 [Paenibacillus larvae subsp. pulvifaciens]
MNPNQVERMKTVLEQSFIRDYMEDEGITDITWNGTVLYLQHNKKGRYAAPNQPTIQEVKDLARHIAYVTGKGFNEKTPIMNTEIGHFRVNVMHEEISPSGITFALRVSRPRLAVSTLTDLVPEQVAVLLQLLVQAKTNILISGACGSGKTELQKLLVGFIPDDQKITLIEDTMDSHIKELYPQKDINSWRSLTSERREKKVTMQTLIQEALRNNPDWVIISETRGVEAADMLDSAKTGHAVITTLHAESATSIPTRLRSMIRQSPAYAQEDNILLGKDIVDLLPIGVYMKQKYLNGEIVRRIVDVVEFTGFSQEGVQVRGLYSRWNRWEDVYEEQHFYTSLSDKMKNRLKNAELYHLLPKEFK